MAEIDKMVQFVRDHSVKAWVLPETNEIMVRGIYVDATTKEVTGKLEILPADWNEIRNWLGY